MSPLFCPPAGHHLSTYVSPPVCTQSPTHWLTCLLIHSFIGHLSSIHMPMPLPSIHLPGYTTVPPSTHLSIHLCSQAPLHPSVHLAPHQADVPGEGQKFPGNVAAGGTEAGEADREGKECMRDSVHERRDPRGSRKALGAGSCRLSSQTGSASWRLCDLGKTLLFSGPRIPDLQVHMPGYRDM